jgi:ABC-type branched-subunit amino acid transport system ATPase component
VTSPAGLAIEDLTIAYGGNVAVERATLSAPMGQVTGLIGPNGAGKSSLFNGCCGLVRPRNGRIRLGDRDITGASTAARARAGLGRTFQVMQLIGAMSARENVELGVAARYAGRHPLRHLTAGATARRRVQDAADVALERCGIGHLADRPTNLLSTGQRRLVELARAAAGGFDVLLLDEPSSGLDESETERFGETVRSIVDEDGVGVLLVEHDMDLVMGICEHLFVIEFGRMLADGTPEEIRNDPLVRAAYLGEEAA